MIFRCRYRYVLAVLVLFAAFVSCGSVRAQVLTGYDPAEIYLDFPSGAQVASAEVLPPPDPVGRVSAQRRRPFLTTRNAPPLPEPDAPDLKASLEDDTGKMPVTDAQLPVDLTADNLRHDDATDTITASGHVEITQGARVLKADEVRYDMRNDTVMALGNVILYEPTGDVHFADEVTLSDNMRNGFVSGLQSFMTGGGQFTAEEGRRINEKLIVMHNASYTPCECENDADGNPAWRIRASEVTLDEEEHRVKYKNARFEIYGVPVLYTPILAHADGKVKRKSGFLTPSVGYDSQLGGTYTQSYYYSIAPDKDATIGVMAATREAPVALGEYRQRFAQAELKAAVSATRSNRTDNIAGQEVVTDEEFRGHVFADGRWDINEKYRAGINIEAATDDQYLRQYDFSSKDVLENQLYVERFSGRNYAVARALAFQDVRVQEEKTDQPDILPEVEASFIGEPGQTLGGRWDAQVSALDLQRNGGQDMVRLTGRAGWQRREVSRAGLVGKLDLSVRGDAYRVGDRDVAQNGSGRSAGATATRVMPRANATVSYPLVRPLERVQVLVEPIAALTAATDVDNADDGIPNEDSQDVQLDASNLFEPGRFPGKDLFEDRIHATYGGRTGIYGFDGSYGEVFVGQSYRFHGEDNPFPKGSGLENNKSDWVGQIAAAYQERFGVNYRFQLAADNFSSRRHEVDGFADLGRLDLGSRYLYAAALEGTDISESREQLYGSAAYELTRNWRVRGGVLEDLGSTPGLREATLGLDYLGCCFTFGVTVDRNITSDVSGDSGTDIKFRIGLKGIGDFEGNQSGDYRGGNTGS